VFERVHHPSGASALWLVRTDGRGLRRIPRTAGAGQPTWAPDGRSIAFAGDNEIDAVPPDGSGRRVLAKLPGTDPAWSPDGRSIVFALETERGEEGLDLLTLATGRVSRLTNNGDGPVAWSRDGRWLAYAQDDLTTIGAYDEDLSDLLLMRVADRHVRFLLATTFPFPLGGLAWRSPH
jgi:Tol biopolymer transport system component